MTVDEVVAAFALPASAIRPTRIHKTVLNERGAASAGDRKLIDKAVGRLDWLATLSPASIGVAAGDGVTAIQLLALSARVTPTQRLLAIIHRAVPLPVVLVTVFESNVRLSLAPLRPAERIEGAMVVERLVVTPGLATPDAAAQAFLASLALNGLPRTTLGRLYDGLIWRAEALLAARTGGSAFRSPGNTEEAEARRAALAEYDAVSAEWAKARSAARAEKQLARQVALAETARLVKTRLEAIATALRDDQR